VTKHDLWQEVGGKLDFVQFPATANTPARSGPGHAQTLEHIYRQYLYQFERMFVEGIQRKRAQAAGLTPPGPGPAQAAAVQQAERELVSLPANLFAQFRNEAGMHAELQAMSAEEKVHLAGHVRMRFQRMPGPPPGMVAVGPRPGGPGGPPQGTSPGQSNINTTLSMGSASNPFGANTAISQQELVALGQQYLSDRQRMYHARGRSRLTASDGCCADILSRLCSPA
jgi:hypothetical protein